MKNLVIRTVFTLTLLLTLVAIFAGVNPALAHADAPTPTIQRVDCASELAEIKIITDKGQNEVCFGGTGTIDVKLYNVSVVCPAVRDFPDSGAIWQDDGQDLATSTFLAPPPGQERECSSLDNNDTLGNGVVNQVLSVRIWPKGQKILKW
jgi:hypothetical protein